MGKINVLDAHVAELIAAGEVVERPASVIKEMVENAIDAGASAVTVEIKNGGVTYMRVTDNGCGIGREDVPVAFLRHATSKVSGQDDLESIGTLGFRGEALASIAAVAKVEVMTRTPEDAVGTRYVIEGGEEKLLDDAGCPQGTTFVIRDLFYNTPVRMKFLKKDVTEANAVAGVLDKIALSHPEISVRFIREGKEQLHTPGDGKLQSAIYAVYGRDFTNGLMPVKYEYNHVRVWGFVSRPSNSRPNRSMQQFFINGRCVKSRTAMAALEEAFKGSIMVGKFPACVLHLEMAFQAVDVNIHPAKLEVRFINERPVFDAVYHGVKSALQREDRPKEVKLHNHDLLRPPTKELRGEQIGFSQTNGFSQAKKPAPVAAMDKTMPGSAMPNMAPKNKASSDKVIPGKMMSGKLPSMTPAAPKPSIEKHPVALEKTISHIPAMRDGWRPPYQAGSKLDSFLDEEEEEIVPISKEKPSDCVQSNDVPFEVAAEKQTENLKEQPAEGLEATPQENLPLPKLPQEQELFEAPPARLIGEAFGTYLLLQQGEDQLVLIDKHAAHERLLYEKLRREGGGSHAQMLLEPVTVTLEKAEYDAVLREREIFAEAGFEVDDFGSGTVAVRSAPLSLEQEDVASAVIEMAGYLLTARKDLTTEHLDWLYHNIACRAAVKAGDFSSMEELAALAQRLRENPDVRYCPHGRPVSIVITRHELEKQFGRI